jgi:hypothetical protein
MRVDIRGKEKAQEPNKCALHDAVREWRVKMRVNERENSECGIMKVTISKKSSSRLLANNTDFAPCSKNMQAKGLSCAWDEASSAGRFQDQ